MIGQDKQINTKEKRNNSLPVNTNNEKINRNCMRLYLYLLSISAMNWQEKRRQFRQVDFSVNKIHIALGLHCDTVIKYWKSLEDCGWIKYEGKKYNCSIWKEEFKFRKQNKLGYYNLKKDQLYRLIPKETVEKVQNKFQVTEGELKLYLLLANLQERTLYYKQNFSNLTLKDLCDLREISSKVESKKRLYLELLWLRAVGLIDYKMEKVRNNFGEKVTVINLTNVYYYTNGGEIDDLLDDKSYIAENLKNEWLNSKDIVIFEE